MFAGDIKPMEVLWSHADDVIHMGPVHEPFHIGWKVTDQDWSAQGRAGIGGTIKLIKRHMTLGEGMAVVYCVAEVSGQGPARRPRVCVEPMYTAMKTATGR